MANTAIQHAKVFDDEAGFLYVRDLGEGFFGHVCLVRSLQDGRLYVRKEQKWGDQPGDVDMKDAQFGQRTLTINNTTNLVGYAVYRAEADQHSDFLVTYWEYCNAGNLIKLVDQAKKNATPVPARWLYSWTVTLLRLICSLGEQGMLHRDILPANCFLHRSSKDAMPELVLGDFGISYMAKDFSDRKEYVGYFLQDLTMSIKTLSDLCKFSDDCEGFLRDYDGLVQVSLSKHLVHLLDHLNNAFRINKEDVDLALLIFHDTAESYLATVSSSIKNTPQPSQSQESCLATVRDSEYAFAPYPSERLAAKSQSGFVSIAKVEKHGRSYHISNIEPRCGFEKIESGNWIPGLKQAKDHESGEHETQVRVMHLP